MRPSIEFIPEMEMLSLEHASQAQKSGYDKNASLYDGAATMLTGETLIAFVSALAAYVTQSAEMTAVSILIFLCNFLRWLDWRAFIQFSATSEHTNKHPGWHQRYIVGTCIAAALYGAWCFCASMLIANPIIQAVSFAASALALMGMVARSLAYPKLVLTQTILIAAPIIISLALTGDILNLILAVGFVAFLFIFTATLRGLTLVQNLLSKDSAPDSEAAHLAEERTTALDSMQHGLCVINRDGLITVANEPLLGLFSPHANRSWVGNSFGELLISATKEKIIPHATARLLLQEVSGGQDGKHVFSINDGRHYESTISKRGGRAVLLFEDVTAQLQAQERIKHMARYDTLTGLCNRNHFSDCAKQRLQTAQKSDEENRILLAIVDLDAFKHVNDTYGHVAGDELLKSVADRLRYTLTETALISRFGGDEFTILVHGKIDETSATEMATGLIESLASPFTINGHQIVMSACIGLVLIDNDNDEFADILTKADLALYSAKSKGRSKWSFFVDQMDTDYRYRRHLQEDLKVALKQGDLQLHYQPIIDHRTNRVAGCEALSRWHHPEFGLIPPTVFIPLAEESGLISELTKWALDTAVHDCCTWVDTPFVSVNISARDFRSAEVDKLVEKALSSSGLDPMRLEIEITETAVIEEQEAAVRVMNSVADMGVGIALDDFGTGYSSLSYLHDMPFSKVKVDRTFVTDVTTNERSLKLLSNITRLSKGLELKVTVEGIEDADQLDLIVNRASVDLIQGYFFSRPLPAANISKFISLFNRGERPGRQDITEIEQKKQAGSLDISAQNLAS